MDSLQVRRNNSSNFFTGLRKRAVSCPNMVRAAPKAANIRFTHTALIAKYP
jgi:hypothetical protein